MYKRVEGFLASAEAAVRASRCIVVQIYEHVLQMSAACLRRQVNESAAGRLVYDEV